MDPLLDVLREAGEAVIRLIALPYLYIAIALVWWHARQGVVLQRRLFHVRLHGSLSLTLSRLGAGAAVGLILSAASFGLGAKLNSDTILCIWLAMAVLAVFRLRYICLAYAAAAIGVAQEIAKQTLPDGYDGLFARSFEALLGVDIASLLFLAGLLHIAEGLLVRFQSSKMAIPLFMEGKRGKPVGAYALSGVWPIPLLWLIPSASSADGFTLPWAPLFGDGAASWALLAFPVLIGFSDRTETFWPERKARTSGNALVVYGAIVAALAAGAHWWAPLGAVAAIAAFLLHEGLVLWSRWRENGRNPVFAQDGSGVKVLAVLPGTPAAEMGLVAGETIKKVNGSAVRTKEQLHAALQLQSAFCKMEVVNRDGHVKFVQRARYAGEHYQLGLVLAPDEDVDFVAAPRSASIWQGLREAGARPRNGASWQAAQAELAAARELDAAKEAEREAAEAAAAALAEPAGDPGLPPRKERKNS